MLIPYHNSNHASPEIASRRTGSLFSLVRLAVCVVLLILLRLTAHAATTIEAGPLSLGPDQVQEWTFIAPVNAAGQLTALSLEARVDRLSPGSSNFMEIQINGQPVHALVTRTQSRLRNKDFVVLNQPNSNLVWDTYYAGWLVKYAPDFDEQYVGVYGTEAFRFVIEVNNLVKPGALNTLSIKRRKTGTLTAPLILRNVGVVAVPTLTINNGLKITTSATDLPTAMATSDGGLLLGVGDSLFPVSSSFSVPGGGWRHFGLPVPGRTGETPAVVTVQQSGNTWTMSMQESKFQVARTVQVVNGRALVKDVITNITGQDLGFMVRHDMVLTSPVATVHLGGDPNPLFRDVYAPWNPTVFTPMGDLGLGMVAEDDALRAQARLSYDDGKLGGYNPRMSVRTEKLAIPAGQSAILQWSAYALPKREYYGFINRVRSDWRILQRIDGPYVAYSPDSLLRRTDDDLKAYIQRTKPFAFFSTGWIDYHQAASGQNLVGTGAGVMDSYFADYRRQLKQSIEKIHRAAPAVKVVIYSHMFFNSPEPDPNSLIDSWITRVDGTRYIAAQPTQTNPYTGEPVELASIGGVIPTLTNSFGAAFWNAMRQQRTELGADGFYMDQLQIPLGLADAWTYNQWDGKSAILDPTTFAIQRKIGYTWLLAQGYQHSLFNEARAAGLWLLGNNTPHTLAFNRDTAMVRFTETHSSLNRAYQAHLSSPLAFSNAPTYTVEDLRQRLNLGVIYCTSNMGDRLGIVKRFFPITPTSVHQGWIKGEERIITDRSGNYGWTNATYRYRLWRWDAAGQAVESEPAWQVGQGIMRVEVPTGGIAVLEREERPYKGAPLAVPGIIQAEDFDHGGEGVAFHDTTPGNFWGQYRDTDVDLFWTSLSGGGMYGSPVVGRAYAGEWLEYTVNVATSGNYTVEASVGCYGAPGSLYCGTFHIEHDGVDKTGPLTIPNTAVAGSNSSAFTTVTKTGVNLPAGKHVLRLVFDRNGTHGAVGNFNYFRISPDSGITPTPYGGTFAAIPGVIEAENFDDGGEGIAYRDTTPGNAGRQYRDTDVDIRTISSGNGYAVNLAIAGEWLKYTVNLAAPATYTIEARVASSGGGTFHIECDGVDKTGPLTAPDTGSSDAFTTVTKTGVRLPAGKRVLRLVFDGSRSTTSGVGSFDSLRIWGEF